MIKLIIYTLKKKVIRYSSLISYVIIAMDFLLWKQWKQDMVSPGFIINYPLPQQKPDNATAQMVAVLYHS